MKSQSIYQKRANQRIQKNADLMANVCKSAVVTDSETAQQFGEGLKKWLALDPDKRAELSKLDKDEIVKHLETDMAAAGDIINRAASNVNKALTGTMIREKGQSENLSDLPSLQVASGIATADDLQFDMGWTQLFNVVDAGNVADVKVMDLHGAMRMVELANRSDKIASQPLATRKSESFGPRFFGAAFDWLEREMRFSVYSVNNALTAMRASAVNNTTIMAYRIAASMGANSNEWDTTALDVKGFTGGSTDIEKRKNKAIRARLGLNNAHFRLINEASNKQSTSGKRKQTYDSAPIEGLTAQTPLYFVTNHKWFEMNALVQGMTPGEDGINPGLLRPIVFIESIHMPECGAHTITEANEPDDWGFLETTAEKAPGSTYGGKLIIPGRRNIMAIFRPNTLFSDRGRAADEGMTITIKQEQNGVMESRQHAYLKLGDNKH